MQSYPIDVEPEQLVRRLVAEHDGAASKFEVVASCVKEAREFPPNRESRIGDELREDAPEVVTVATLKITPLQRTDGWSPSVVQVDLGPPLSGEDSASGEGEEEEIDVDVLYNELLGSGRGGASVVAEVWTLAAKQRLSAVFVHYDVKPPVQAVLHPPRASRDVAGAFV